MMEAVVEVCRAFAVLLIITVSKKKIKTMYMPPARTSRMMMRVQAAGKPTNRTYITLHLSGGGALTETPDISTKIVRWICAYWMCIRRYLIKVSY